MTVDVAAFRRQPDGSRLALLADPASNGEAVTGLDKLVQRTLLHLLTPRGSLPYHAGVGTCFMPILLGEKASSELDVVSGFAAAAAQLAPLMRGEESEADPADERFHSLVLNQLIVTPGAVTMRMTVQAASGRAAETSWSLTLDLR